MFNTAQKFQEKQDKTKNVSVVVLDEVGLAEDSPNLPLKALHPLLEDGTEGVDQSKQVSSCHHCCYQFCVIALSHMLVMFGIVYRSLLGKSV